MTYVSSNILRVFLCVFCFNFHVRRPCYVGLIYGAFITAIIYWICPL